MAAAPPLHPARRPMFRRSRSNRRCREVQVWHRAVPSVDRLSGRRCLLAALDGPPAADRLGRPKVAAGDADGALELFELRLRDAHGRDHDVPIDDLGARGCRQRAAVGVVLGDGRGGGQEVEVDRAFEVRHRHATLISGCLRQEVLELLEEGVRARAHLVEDAEHAVAVRPRCVRGLLVNAVHHHSHLLAADGMLRAPVEVALEEAVDHIAELHHPAAAQNIELHGVPVVFQPDLLRAPVQAQWRSRVRDLALRQIDGALHLAVGAHTAGPDHARGPRLRVVRVPLIQDTPVDRTVVQGLRRAVVAPGGRPADGVLEFAQLRRRQ
mmetsp:Transcript_28437/g.82310  ORF Transcript_28437/g.82310 Transcript_28437/m.82310 type:complete len:325 (+) Transcript_28437:108-1082(+)